MENQTLSKSGQLCVWLFGRSSENINMLQLKLCQPPLQLIFYKQFILNFVYIILITYYYLTFVNAENITVLLGSQSVIIQC